MNFLKNLGSAALGLCCAVVAVVATIAALPCLLLSGVGAMVGIKEDTPILCIIHIPLAITSGLAYAAGSVAAWAWGIDLDDTQPANTLG